jgi:lysophospholipase L1-like esterase
MMTPRAARRRSISVLVTVVVAVPACANASTARGSRADTSSRVRTTAPTTPITDLITTSTTTTTLPPAPTTVPTTAPVVAGAAPITAPGIFAIGDSVMLGAAPQLRAKGIGVDAAESRQWNTGASILGMRAAAGQLPRVVVVHLGTNGPINAGQVDAMMRVLGGHRVVLITAHEPRWWQNQVNDTLRAGVARWPGTVLLDWDAEGSVHPEWFYNDRIHLRPRGAQAYADLVAALTV